MQNSQAEHLHIRHMAGAKSRLHTKEHWRTVLSPMIGELHGALPTVAVPMLGGVLARLAAVGGGGDALQKLHEAHLQSEQWMRPCVASQNC